MIYQQSLDIDLYAEIKTTKKMRDIVELSGYCKKFISTRNYLAVHEMTKKIC